MGLPFEEMAGKEPIHFTKLFSLSLSAHPCNSLRRAMFKILHLIVHDEWVVYSSTFALKSKVRRAQLGPFRLQPRVGDDQALGPVR